MREKRGRKRRRLKKRTRKGCGSETQRGRDGWVVRTTRAAVSSIELRPLAGREDLVQVAIAAEGARPDVDEGDAAAREVALERPFRSPVARERVAVTDDDRRRATAYSCSKRRLQAAHFHSIQARAATAF